MSSRTFRLFPLAYHFSLQAYGRWLPGDPRGWHRRGDGTAAPPRSDDPVIYGLSRELQRYPAATITEPAGATILQTLSSIALEHEWRVYAMATTPTHLHAVVSAPMKGVDILRLIRDESQRRLVEHGLIEPSRPFWSAGGYFSMVHTVRGLERACRYVALHRTEASTVDVAARPVAPLR